MHPSVSFNTSFSQKWITYQSFPLKSLSFRISRAIFSSILAIQYSRLRFSFGLRSSQFCPCQNSPSTKMAILYFRIAISGEPGSRLSFSLYRKGLPPCPASDGHETSVWMFPGSYHMILDVSFGFITVSEVSHPHKRFYYQRRCTAKASADSIVYCGPGDFQAYSTVVQLPDSTRSDHPHNLLR